MPEYTDEEIEQFELIHHIHIGEELTVSVNPYGKMTLMAIGNEIEGASGYAPKVLADISILRVKPEEFRQLSKFFKDIAKTMEAAVEPKEEKKDKKKKKSK